MTNLDQKACSTADGVYGDEGEVAVVAFLEKVSTVTKVILYPFGKYDIDIEVYDSVQGVYYIDVERRRNWNAEQVEWPYWAVHVPFRKKAMLEKYPSCFYWVIRDDLARFVVLSKASILESDVMLGSDRKHDEYVFTVRREDVLGYLGD